MKFEKPVSLKKISELFGAKYAGTEDFNVTGINEIHRVVPGDITFVDHPKYYDKVLSSDASVIIINKEVESPSGKFLLISDDPFTVYNNIALHFRPVKGSANFVSETAEVGSGTIIQPGAFVGNHAKIGRNCFIHSNVSIYDHTVIGDNVIIHSNTIIGSDAFYYKRRPDYFEKMHSCGRVIIEDNVEIGAGSAVDKGVSSDTIIGKGTKIDNHVHVGHDTVIGKNCLFAAHVAIAGVVNIEDEVILWGQVGVNKDLTIGKGAVVLAQAGIAKSLKGNTTYWGSPVIEARKKMKELALMKRLPEIIERLDSGKL